jgi:hypothetical protein
VGYINYDEDNQCFVIRGDEGGCRVAKRTIEAKIGKGKEKGFVTISSLAVGLVIGRGGATIKSIKSDTKVGLVEFEPDDITGLTRVIIQGPSQMSVTNASCQVLRAAAGPGREELFMEIVAQGAVMENVDNLKKKGSCDVGSCDVAVYQKAYDSLPPRPHQTTNTIVDGIVWGRGYR